MLFNIQIWQWCFHSVSVLADHGSYKAEKCPGGRDGAPCTLNVHIEKCVLGLFISLFFNFGEASCCKTLSRWQGKHCQHFQCKAIGYCSTLLFTVCVHSPSLANGVHLPFIVVKGETPPFPPASARAEGLLEKQMHNVECNDSNRMRRNLENIWATLIIATNIMTTVLVKMQW